MHSVTFKDAITGETIVLHPADNTSDERLRQHCLELAVSSECIGVNFTLETAKSYFDFIKGAGQDPAPDQQAPETPNAPEWAAMSEQKRIEVALAYFGITPVPTASADMMDPKGKDAPPMDPVCTHNPKDVPHPNAFDACAEPAKIVAPPTSVQVIHGTLAASARGIRQDGPLHAVTLTFATAAEADGFAEAFNVK